ncbi:hypothetical protein QBC39DRAFT_400131 [Podospora conica]|nr:hypothetical protein QBC39DRAFT_400131 [Schizothecium conicum]
MKASRLIRGQEGVLNARDDTVVPAVCYEVCNNAYLEAQTVGKTPALCESTSPFMNYYTIGCVPCINANAADPAQVLKEYIEPKFAQFINYCAGLVPTGRTTFRPALSTVTVAPDLDTASLESKWSSIGRVASSEGYLVLPTNLVIVTTETSSVFITLSDGSVTNVPVTQVSTIPNLSAWNFTVPATGSGTFSSTSTSLSSGLPPETPPPGSTPLTDPTPPSGPPPPSGPNLPINQTEINQAWIAGPVIGGVVAFALLTFAGFFLFFILPRRRDAAKSEGNYMAEKAQLHADSMQRSPPPGEMEGEVNTFPELGANEVAAAELSVERLAELSAERLADLSAERLADLSAERLAELSAEDIGLALGEPPMPVSPLGPASPLGRER